MLLIRLKIESRLFFCHKNLNQIGLNQKNYELLQRYDVFIRLVSSVTEVILGV